MKEGFPTKKLYQYLKGSRGSSLIAVFLILTVLLVLGLGVMTLSQGSAKQAVTGDTYEKLYYPAEGGAQKGIAYLQSAVDKTYNKIVNGTVANNANAFFAELKNVTGIGVLDSTRNTLTLDTTTGSAVSSSSVNITEMDENNPRRYSIEAKTTSGTISRTVSCTFQVRFTPVEPLGSGFGTSSLFIGGDMTFLEFNATLGFYGDTNYPAIMNDFSANGSTIVNQYYIHKQSSAITKPLFNWNIPSNYCNTFVGKPGFTLAGNSEIYGTQNKDTPIPSPIKIVSNTNCSDITIQGANNTLADSGAIYCRGTLTLDGCNLNNMTIYCNGNIIVCGGGSLTQCIVYAENNIRIGDLGNNGNNLVTITKSFLYTNGTANLGERYVNLNNSELAVKNDFHPGSDQGNPRAEYAITTTDLSFVQNLIDNSALVDAGIPPPPQIDVTLTPIIEQ